MFRQEPNKNLPPRPFMIRVMDKVCKAYLFLWDKKDEEYKFDISWKDLSKCYNKNVFRTSVRRLGEEGLLSFQESPSGIHIELKGKDNLQDV
jgi:hypothetical protein